MSNLTEDEILALQKIAETRLSVKIGGHLLGRIIAELKASRTKGVVLKPDQPPRDVVEVPVLEDEEIDALFREFADKEEWPDDGVSEDFMEYVRWGFIVGMRTMAARLSPPAAPNTEEKKN